MEKDYTEDDVRNEVKTKVFGKNLVFFDEIDSTNDFLKKNVMEFPEGTVIVAKSQTNGRGRRGNNWENGESDSVFMSFLVKPNVKFDSLLRISLVCSLSVLQALKFTGIDVGIKWPNDIIINNKKVCGILTECVTHKNGLNSLIIGIGMNVNNSSFNGSLEDKATSLFLEGVDTNIPFVIASILSAIEKNYYTYLQYGFGFFINEYKKRCININKDVVVINGDTKVNGKIIDVNRDGTLLFESEDGKTSNLLSNEISIRGVNGYI